MQRKSGRFSKGPTSMKLGIIFIAFTIGCIATAFVRVAPDASANNTNPTADAPFEFSSPGLQEPQQETLDIVVKAFGQTKAGDKVRKFICTNVNGMTLEFIDYGATITAVRIPSGDEKVNVCLSCNDMAGYEACSSYFGSTVGSATNNTLWRPTVALTIFTAGTLVLTRRSGRPP